MKLELAVRRRLNAVREDRHGGVIVTVALDSPGVTPAIVRPLLRRRRESPVSLPPAENEHETVAQIAYLVDERENRVNLSEIEH